MNSLLIEDLTSTDIDITYQITDWFIPESDKIQYDFLRAVIRKGKRYNKWIKAEEENLTVIQEYFGYSFNKAKEALKILTDDDLSKIKDFMKKSKGGRL